MKHIGVLILLLLAAQSDSASLDSLLAGGQIDRVELVVSFSRTNVLTGAAARHFTLSLQETNRIAKPDITKAPVALEVSLMHGTNGVGRLCQFDNGLWKFGQYAFRLRISPPRDKSYVEDTGSEMAAAIAKAQETLPHFWQTYDQRARGESNFVLVVRITDKGRIEHFFSPNFDRRDGKTFFTITNEPKIVANVKSGDRIEIPKTDITDWFYMLDGKYVGMRTMPPRFKLMPAEQVEAFKQVLVDP